MSARAEAPVWVLAPHPDDAAFSVGLTLHRLARRGTPIRLVTVFSRSAYAPGLSSDDPDVVTTARAEEDRRFARLLGKRTRRVDLGRDDAPLRSGYRGPEDLFRDSPFSAAEEAELDALLPALGGLREAALALVPLALGDHVDHRIVQAAALAAGSPERLAFYEDLPYACEAREGETAAAVERLRRRFGVDTTPVVVCAPTALPDKHAAIAIYRSQLAGDDTIAMLHYALRYGRGERLWAGRKAAPLLAALGET